MECSSFISKGIFGKYSKIQRPPPTWLMSREKIYILSSAYESGKSPIAERVKEGNSGDKKKKKISIKA